MGKSPFERLSPELRNKIYDQALIHSEEIEVAKSAQTDTLITTNKKRATDLLQVCRLFRDEASGIFYSSNHFRFHGQATPDFSTSGVSDVAETISKFVSKIGDRNAKYLRYLTAQLSVSFKSGVEGFATFEATRDQLRQLHRMRRRLCVESFVCHMRVSRSFMGSEATNAFTLDFFSFETSRKTALEVIKLPVSGFESTPLQFFLELHCEDVLENCAEDRLREMAVD